MAGRLSVRRRHQRIRGRRAVLPGLADPDGVRQLRRVRRAGDADPVDLQLRLRDRRRRRPDGHGRARSPADRDGLAPGTGEAAAVAAARSAYLAGFAYTSNLAAGRAYGIPDHRYGRPRVHASARRTSRRRSHRRWPRSASRPRCWSTRTTSRRVSATRSRWPGPNCGRSGSTRATCPCSPSHARQLLDSSRRHRHEDRRLRRPRRVRDRRARRRTGRHLRRRYGRRDRLRCIDRGPGLQARRGRRSPGREAQREQGHGRRPENRGAPAQADRYGDRGDRRVAGRTGLPRPATGCCNATS